MVETLESIGAQTGIKILTVGEIARRVMPRALAWRAAQEFMTHARAVTPLWRWVAAETPVAGQNLAVAARGTSLAGVGGLALTLGVPIVVAVGSWVILGSGYYQARKEVRRKGFMTGFSHGFVTAVHKWTYDQTIDVFLKRFVIRTNVWDPVMDREEALGYNEGLIKGWGVGDAVPENFIRYKRFFPSPYSGKNTSNEWVSDRELASKKDRIGMVPVKVDKKKSMRIALRRIAENNFTGSWSRNEDEKYQQQSSYVRDLGGKGLLRGLIVPE
jgi:hypothetical protein